MTDTTGTTTLTYDPRGNVTERANSVGVLSYSYDAANNRIGTDSDNAQGSA